MAELKGGAACRPHIALPRHVRCVPPAPSAPSAPAAVPILVEARSNLQFILVFFHTGLFFVKYYELK